jgi:hypothetical protein
MYTALCALVIFQIGSCIYAQVGQEYDPPIYASHGSRNDSCVKPRLDFIGWNWD